MDRVVPLASVAVMVLASSYALAAPGAPPRASSAAAPIRAPTQVPFDIFFNDESESPGSVYRYRPGSGTVDTIYTRPSGTVAAFSVHYLPHKLYFVAGSSRDIYRVDNVNGQWQSEQVIFTHGTYVRDIAFFAQGGGTPILYFSDAQGAGGDGHVYTLEYGKAVEQYRVRLNQVHGYWAGYFAYDADGTLYLSSGNTARARLYRVVDGTPDPIFQAVGAITGFAPADGTVYYSDIDRFVRRARLSDGQSWVIHNSSTHSQITDVQTAGEAPALPTATASMVPTEVPSPTPVVTASATATTVPSPTPPPTATTVPTRTPTATAPEPTATDVPTTVPTATATVVPSRHLAGTVNLDGRSDHRGVLVIVDGSPVATSDASGRFDVGPLELGAHTVDLRYAGYLRAGARPFTVTVGASTRLPGAFLLGGDTSGDGQIDIVDGAIVTAAFDSNAGGPGFDSRADINGDGTVDIHDLVMVGSNFGCRVDDSAGRCRRWLDG